MASFDFVFKSYSDGEMSVKKADKMIIKTRSKETTRGDLQ